MKKKSKNILIILMLLMAGRVYSASFSINDLKAVSYDAFFIFQKAGVLEDIIKTYIDIDFHNKVESDKIYQVIKYYNDAVSVLKNLKVSSGSQRLSEAQQFCLKKKIDFLVVAGKFFKTVKDDPNSRKIDGIYRDSVRELKAFNSRSTPSGQSLPSPAYKPVEKKIPEKVQQPPRVVKEKEEGVILNFKGADINHVLTIMSELMGITFIKDDKVTGKITVINPKRVTREKAFEIFESALELKGFTIMKSGDIYKVVPLDKSREMYTDVIPAEKETPLEDKIITKVINLTYATAGNLLPVVQVLIARFESVGVYNNRALVFTGLASNINKLEKIIHELDVEVSDNTVTEMIELKYTSSDNIIPLLRDIFNIPDVPSRRGRKKVVESSGTINKILPGLQPDQVLVIATPGGLRRVKETIAKLDVDNFSKKSIKKFSIKNANVYELSNFLDSILIEEYAEKKLPGKQKELTGTPLALFYPDNITNSIIVITTPRFMSVIEKLIEQFDYEGFLKFKVKIFHLDYADPKTIAGILEKVLNKGSTSSEKRDVLIMPEKRINALVMASSSKRMIRKATEIIKNLDVLSPGSNIITKVYYLKNASAKNLETILRDLYGKDNSKDNKTLTVEKTEPAPAQVTVQGAIKEVTGKVVLVADEITNSLIISTSEANMPAVLETIDKLDITPLQVLIEVLIANAILDDEVRLGIEWQKDGTLHYGRSNPPYKTGQNFGLVTAEKNSLLSGFRFAIVDSARFQAVLHALQTQAKMNIIATPRIFASNNQKASIMLGDKVPVKTAESISDAGQIVNSFEYIDVGIKLELTPHINQQKDVTIELAQELKSIRPSTQNSATAGGNPIIRTEEAKTTATVRNRETLVIGGLLREDDTVRTDGVPILSKIPIIGFLFRNRNVQKSKTELIIFLTPHVVNTSEEIKDITSKEKSLEDKVRHEQKKSLIKKLGEP